MGNRKKVIKWQEIVEQEKSEKQKEIVSWSEERDKSVASINKKRI